MVAKSVQEAIAIKQLLMKDMADPKTTPVARAALARAWSTVQESIRVMRGIPLPGQLRPDLDPAMNAKRGKRGKAMLEIAMMPAESPDLSAAPAPGKSAKPATTARDILDAAEELVKQVGDETPADGEATNHEGKDASVKEST